MNGFPTLNIYKDGEKVEEFNGKRGLEDLVAFVDKAVAGSEAKKDDKDELWAQLSFQDIASLTPLHDTPRVPYLKDSKSFYHPVTTVHNI